MMETKTGLDKNIRKPIELSRGTGIWIWVQEVIAPEKEIISS
jgi:hypothetical protein